MYSKNLDLNLEAQKYIQKKFQRLHRHLNAISDAKLEVSRTSSRSTSDRVRAQMTLTASGYTLRGQESGVNLFAAVDAVVDVIDRQIQRYKGKVYRTAQAKRLGKVGAAGPPGPFVASEDDDLEAATGEGDLGSVVRTKHFPMIPMTVEDAILQMELVNHDFFLFYNVETKEYNVAYRRRDGDYGVIEPELS